MRASEVRLVRGRWDMPGGAGLAGLALLPPALRVRRARSGRWALGRGYVVVVSVVLVSTWLSGVSLYPQLGCYLSRSLPVRAPVTVCLFHAYGTSGPHLLHGSN